MSTKDVVFRGFTGVSCCEEVQYFAKQFRSLTVAKGVMSGLAPSSSQVAKAFSQKCEAQSVQGTRFRLNPSIHLPSFRVPSSQEFQSVGTVPPLVQQRRTLWEKTIPGTRFGASSCECTSHREWRLLLWRCFSSVFRHLHHVQYLKPWQGTVSTVTAPPPHSITSYLSLFKLGAFGLGAG